MPFSSFSELSRMHIPDSYMLNKINGYVAIAKKVR
jgi:hypothetical protein